MRLRQNQGLHRYATGSQTLFTSELILLHSLRYHRKWTAKGMLLSASRVECREKSKSGNFGRINVYLSNDSNKTEITGTDCTGIFRVAKQRCKPKS